MTTRSPYGPPLLHTILSTINRPSTTQPHAPSETLAGIINKTKKRKPSINSTTKKYLAINESDTDTATKQRKSRLTINKSKRKLYSQRFEDDLPKDSNVAGTDDGPEIIIPETQEDANVPAITDNNASVSRSPNVRVSGNRNSSKGRGGDARLSRKTADDSDTFKMPPPPPPIQKPRGRGRPRKKQPVQDYVRPEEPSTSNSNRNATTKSVTVDVYVDSDQGSDTNSVATTKSKSSMTHKERYGLKPFPLLESAVFDENGVRKSKRTKFLKTDKPNAGIVVTTEELDALYRKLAPPNTILTTKYTRK